MPLFRKRSPEFIVSPHAKPVNLKEGLFAPSDARVARPAVVPHVVKSESQPGQTEPVSGLGLVDEYRKKLVSEARAVLAASREIGEDYSLANATREEIIAMGRAVGLFGATIARESGTDSSKVDIAGIQLNDVLSDKATSSEEEGRGSVDAATFVLTAISLARMKEAGMTDQADKILAGEALETMRGAGALDRIRHEEALGPHTGELAVAAIVGYQPPEV